MSARATKNFMPIRLRSLKAARLMAAKITRNVELAKDDIIVKSVVLKNIIVKAVIKSKFK